MNDKTTLECVFRSESGKVDTLVLEMNYDKENSPEPTEHFLENICIAKDIMDDDWKREKPGAEQWEVISAKIVEEKK